jgi:exonuclease III
VQGLRLDYFVCPPALFAEAAAVRAVDCWSLPDGFGAGNASAPSDHCPIGLTLLLRSKSE